MNTGRPRPWPGDPASSDRTFPAYTDADVRGPLIKALKNAGCFFVDEKEIQSARRALGVRASAEAVRLAIERVAEMDEFWRFMTRSRRSLRPGSIETP